MELNIIIDDYSMNLDIPEAYLASAADTFDNLDAELDKGCQLGREWLEQPDLNQRCQFAANKLLTALETHNQGLALISAGYIVSRMPRVQRVTIDTSGEMSGTRFD